jgi:hypothetical protein
MEEREEGDRRSLVLKGFGFRIFFTDILIDPFRIFVFLCLFKIKIYSKLWNIENS